MYRTIEELTKEEMEELKQTYYYDVLNSEEIQQYQCFEDIPDSVIISCYDGYEFTEDDFFCNIKEGY